MDLLRAFSERDNAGINIVELYSKLKLMSSLLPISRGLLKSGLQIIHDVKIVNIFP